MKMRGSPGVHLPIRITQVLEAHGAKSLRQISGLITWIFTKNACYWVFHIQRLVVGLLANWAIVDVAVDVDQKELKWTIGPFVVEMEGGSNPQDCCCGGNAMTNQGRNPPQLF